MSSPENLRNRSHDSDKDSQHEDKNSVHDASPRTPDRSRDSDRSREPSHIMEGKYAILMETNGREVESWMYFIRREGNEEALKHLEQQLNKVDWHIIDDLSTFDLDLQDSVSAQTAKEMTKIDLNAYSFHRKFDGKLDMINLEFRKRDDDETKMCKTFDQLGYGQIEDYISDEDIDDEDLETDSDRSRSSDESESESESESDHEQREGREGREGRENRAKRPARVPSSLNDGRARHRKRSL